MQITSSRSPESSSRKRLRDLLVSGHPLLYIMTAEEQRVGLLLREVALPFFREPVPLWSWSLTEGM